MLLGRFTAERRIFVLFAMHAAVVDMDIPVLAEAMVNIMSAMSEPLELSVLFALCPDPLALMISAWAQVASCLCVMCSV